jgi:hypothetical protein
MPISAVRYKRKGQEEIYIPSLKIGINSRYKPFQAQKPRNAYIDDSFGFRHTYPLIQISLSKATVRKIIAMVQLHRDKANNIPRLKAALAPFWSFEGPLVYNPFTERYV